MSHLERANEFFHQAINQAKDLSSRAALAASLCLAMAAVEVVESEPAVANGGYPWAHAANHNPASYEWWIDENGDNTKQLPDELMDPNKYYYKNCTSYVAWKIGQLTGKVPMGMGNGGQWDDTARTHGYTVDNTPEPGDAAVWDYMYKDDPWGHVAFVESVNKDGTANISQWNIPNGSYSTQNNVRAHHYVDFNGTGVGIDGAVGSESAAPVKYDDFVIYRAQNGTGYWYVKNGVNTGDTLINGARHGGWSQDVPLAVDVNGDGYDDMGIYRVINGTGYWYVRNGVNSADIVVNGFRHGGWAQDKPFGGDFDGDGKDDFGIARLEGNTLRWYVKSSKTGNPTPIWGAAHGSPGDIPVAADVNGDKIDDFGVYRVINGTGYWYFKSGANGQPTPIWGSVHGGWPGDKPVAGDMNGDKIDDFGIVRFINGTAYWYFKSGSDGQPITSSAWGVAHGGWAGDVPMAGNFG